MAIENLIHTAVGTELVRKLAEAGDRFFTIERARELAPSVSLSEGYLRQALHHLARSGWVVRLRKGLYALSSAVPGVSVLHEFEIAMALVSPAAVSHWSALHHHGLTEQLPRRVFVLTTTEATVPRPRGKRAGMADKGYPVGETVYRFVQVKPERFFGVEEIWVGEARVKVTDPERTLLDGLLMPRYCGDFAEVLHAFQVRAEKLDMDRIIGYTLRMDAAAAKRLGWILEQQGVDTARLEPLLAIPIKGYRVLDPTGPRRGPCDRRWMIQENLPGKVAR
ncbi:MAG: type IV toxin-antitoxin system AbiEi family antitoxin domain-containing protein [Candidatus Omnitrophica bacterium]|nr:type IV toxin-antitoxin system AbiEi family antitoxin domain-containing protein [Candidatus Omnitrophota bacterium]